MPSYLTYNLTLEMGSWVISDSREMKRVIFLYVQKQKVTLGSNLALKPFRQDGRSVRDPHPSVK